MAHFAKINLHSFRSLLLIFPAVILLTNTSCAGSVREPSVSGQFYPNDPKELKHTISHFLSQADIKKPTGSVLGILAPHAGYIYSGRTAAYSFKLLSYADPDTIVIIGHDSNSPDIIAFLPSAHYFKTPLGNAPVDADMVSSMVKFHKNIVINDSVHSREHTVEVQLPFIQYLNKRASIVPVIFGYPTVEKCKILADAILKCSKNKEIIILASTDMSHYPKYDTAKKVDSSTIEAIKTMDIHNLFAHLKNQEKKGYSNLQTALCARGGVGTAMLFAKSKGATKARFLNYSNSGDAPMPYGRKSSVVGYCSVVFLNEEEKPNMSEFSIKPKNQSILLKIARDTIKTYLNTGQIPDFSSNDPELNQNAAVFVTLHTKEGHRLRGCIGTTVAHLPLHKAVQQYAIASATQDYRFHPLKESELPGVNIEISVLSPMQEVKSDKDVIQNIHGVMIKRGSRSGLFLPQVWEHFSNKADFLSELCSQKAGLSRDAYKDPKTGIYVFTVFAFEEQPHR